MKIELATPTRGNPDSQFLECRDILIERLKEKGHQVAVSMTCGSSLIDHARSMVASAFLEAPEEVDVLLWLDDDMLFDADEVMRMAEAAHDKMAVVGAVSMAKRPKGHPNFIPLPGTTDLHFFAKGSIVEVVSIGTGICAVSREVFLSMLSELPDIFPKILCGGVPTYPFYANIIHNGEWYGEDSSFCVRARQAGRKVFIDSRVRCFHKGNYLYGLEDSGTLVDRVGTLHMQFAPNEKPA